VTDVAAIAAELVLTDAMTPDDHETLRPAHYIVNAENVEYLVATVLKLAGRED
jgi:hypothetical protein